MSGPIVNAFARLTSVSHGRRSALGAISGMVLSATHDSFSAAAKKKRKRNDNDKRKQPATCPTEAAECRAFVTRFCTLAFPAQFNACTTDLIRCCDLVVPCDLDLATQCFSTLLGTS
jgi:hypothetical protein